MLQFHVQDQVLLRLNTSTLYIRQCSDGSDLTITRHSTLHLFGILNAAFGFSDIAPLAAFASVVVPDYTMLKACVSTSPGIISSIESHTTQLSDSKDQRDTLVCNSLQSDLVDPGCLLTPEASVVWETVRDSNVTGSAA